MVRRALHGAPRVQVIPVGDLVRPVRDQHVRTDVLDDARELEQALAVEDQRGIGPAEAAELTADELGAPLGLRALPLADLLERDAWIVTPQSLRLLSLG